MSDVYVDDFRKALDKLQGFISQGDDEDMTVAKLIDLFNDVESEAGYLITEYEEKRDSLERLEETVKDIKALL